MSYTDLITGEHQQPKFIALVDAVTGDFQAINDALRSINFDLDTALGVQLDAIGQWAGITRNLSVPLTGVYFTLDDATLGLDAGSLKGPYDPIEGLLSLDDDSYRALIKAKVAANKFGGTNEEIAPLLQNVVGPDTAIVVSDNQDMSLTVYFVGASIPPITEYIVQLIAETIKPSGVRIAGYFYLTHPLFGLDFDTTFVKGLDAGYFAS